MKQGDVPINGIFYADGMRYQRIGETSILPINKDGTAVNHALVLHPFEEVDNIEMESDTNLDAKEIQNFIDNMEIEVASKALRGNRLKLIRLVSTPTYKVIHDKITLVTTPSLIHAIKVFKDA